MSIETIKSEITRFLESETPEVMAIKGKWGTGKTHLWNKLLKENKEKIKFEKYSYVSLFGINSLDIFKYAIFENTVSRNLIGKDSSIENFKENLLETSTALGKKGLEIFKSKSNSHTIESLAFLSIRNTLICIDDLERKGKNLDIKDILGLVSLLKEQRNCKVVLLLNEGEDGLGDYAKYCEKVVDIELVFAPTAKENVEIAFNGKDDYAIQVVKESAIKLNIKNIRILKQIERFVGLVTPHLSDCELEITQQVASSLTLFAWCHYCHDGNVPSLDYIASTKNFYFGFDEEKNETDEQKKQKEWKTTILDYGFTHTDDLDLLLIQLVKTGYIIEVELNEKLKQKNAEAITSKSKTTFHSCWNLFHDCLDNNETEIVSAFYKNFKTNVKYYSNSELRLVVHLFRELEENDKAEELIDLYINSNNSDIEQFNLKWADHKHITDASIKEKFKEFYSTQITEQLKQETIKEVFSRIHGEHKPRDKDLELFKSFDVYAYIELFKNKDYPFDSSIRTCLQFNDNSNYQEISDKAIEALKSIAGECKINRHRISRYIVID
jgi:hypothetical protein